MILEGAEYIEGKDGEEGYWITHITEEYFPEEGKRHSRLCEVCGMSSYPKCRDVCPNGKTINKDLTKS